MKVITTWEFGGNDNGLKKTSLPEMIIKEMTHNLIIHLGMFLEITMLHGKRDMSPLSNKLLLKTLLGQLHTPQPDASEYEMH